MTLAFERPIESMSLAQGYPWYSYIVEGRRRSRFEPLMFWPFVMDRNSILGHSGSPLWFKNQLRGMT
jgi:hypothetical protein